MERLLHFSGLKPDNVLTSNRFSLRVDEKDDDRLRSKTRFISLDELVEDLFTDGPIPGPLITC